MVAPVLRVAPAFEQPVALQLVDERNKAAREDFKLRGQSLLGAAGVGSDSPEQAGLWRGQPEWGQSFPEALRSQATDLGEQERHATRRACGPAVLRPVAHGRTLASANRSCYKRFMDDTTTSRRTPGLGQTGPPLGLLAGACAGLLLGGIALSAALGGVLPSPFADHEVIRGYFLTHPGAVQGAGVLTFASAVPLSIYAATASARLRQLGVTAPGATIALAGGVLAAGALALSGLLLWTLARPAVRAEQPLVRALHDLAFLAGGSAHVVFLGLLVAGVAVPGLLLGLLSRPLATVGLAVAVLAELSVLSLIWPALAVLLPAARFPALAWLVVAGLQLPHHRARAATP